MERDKGKSLAKFVSDYCIVDIETTGLDPRWDDILEISSLKVLNNEVVDSFNTFVLPDDFLEVPTFITELTGITTDDITNYGISTKNAIDKLMNFIGSNIIVGHNVNFDINFIYDECQNLFQLKFNNDYIDTLRLARHALPQEKHHRLKDLVKIFDIKFDRMHRALDDCKITKIVFDNIRNILGNDWEYKAHYTYYSNHHKFDARTIIADPNQFDREHPFFDKNFVFTGKLNKFTRSEVSQIIANIGAHPQNGINKDTNYLVVGNFDYEKSVKDGISSKQRKAIEKKLLGQDIEIITEEVFMDQL